MEYHPVANIFPMMNDEDFRRLRADIETNGLREAIWTYQGKIIDGRNRNEACLELGVTPEFREWNGQGSLIQFVVSLNLSRRHLSSSQRATVGVKIKRFLEDEFRERRLATLKQNANGAVSQKIDQRSNGNGNGNHGKSAYQAAMLAGTNRQYVHDAEALERAVPELLDLVSDGIIKIPEARQLARMEEQDRAPILEKLESHEAKTVKQALALIHQEEQSTMPEDLPNSLIERCQFYAGELEDIEHLIEDESVDAIITHLPKQTDVYSYGVLGPVAERVLKPGGSLLCAVEQSKLPEAIEALQYGLFYRWTLALMLSGPVAVVPPKVHTLWVPVLWFTKGTYQGPWVDDTVESTNELIERFALPGQTIFDPFMRSGLIVVPAAKMNRKVVGIGTLDALEAVLKRLASINEEG